jgi:hypothetical protein
LLATCSSGSHRRRALAGRQHAKRPKREHAPNARPHSLGNDGECLGADGGPDGRDARRRSIPIICRTAARSAASTSLGKSPARRRPAAERCFQRLCLHLPRNRNPASGPLSPAVRAKQGAVRCGRDARGDLKAGRRIREIRLSRVSAEMLFSDEG